MADLSGVSIDPNVEASTGSSFTLINPGSYKAVIVKDKLTDNRAKTGKILKLKLQITDGQFANKTIDDNINITNPSSQCQAIGQGTLKQICSLCGTDFPPADTDPLHGKEMCIEVGVESFTSNKTGKELQSNKIKAYKKADEAQGASAMPDKPVADKPKTDSSSW